MFDQVPSPLGILPVLGILCLSPVLSLLIILLVGRFLFPVEFPNEWFECLLIPSLEAREKDGVAPSLESVGRFNIPDQKRPSC